MQGESSREERLRIADVVDALLAGRLTYEQYLHQVPEEPEDEDICRVLDLVEHLPVEPGRLGGASPAAYQAHVHALAEALRTLRGRS